MATAAYQATTIVINASYSFVIEVVAMMALIIIHHHHHPATLQTN